MTAITYRRDIDGLRALAVVLVVLFHIGAPGVTGGFVGVDVFFVISGFLITSIIKGDIEAGRFSLLRFYDRRIRRIFPALITVYLFCSAAAAVLLFPSDLIEFGESLAASAFFVSNFLFYENAGYFAAPSHDQPLLHTWSLSVEEQFYVFWPPVLLMLSRFVPARWLTWLIVAGILGSLAFAEWQLRRDGAAAFYLIPSRAWELGLGGLLAFRFPNLDSQPRLRDLLSLAGVAMILYSAVALSEVSAFPGLRAAPACLGTALLILSGAGGIANRLLALRPVVFIGLVSYSLYLWHWPLIVFGRYYLDRDFRPLEAVAVVSASFAAAVLSYRFIEAPFRRVPAQRPPAGQAPRWRARRLVGVGVSAMLVCAAAGGAMSVDGWPWRLPESALAVDRLAAQFDPLRELCHGEDKALLDTADCTLGVDRADGAYDLAVIGDSHAEHLVAGIDMLLKEQGLAGRQVTANGCSPLFGIRAFDDPGSERCQDFAKTITEFLDRHGELKIVVLTARWSLYTETRWLAGEREGRRFITDARDAGFSIENSRRVLADALQRTVAAITERGVRVLLVAQVPPLSRQRTRCMARARWFGGDETACYEPAARAQERTAYSDALIARLAANSDRVDAFFPGQVLCNDRLCVPVLDGIFIFRDEDHLNPTGSELLLSHLVLTLDD